MSNLKVSVIICVYNGEKWIGRAIESVLRQSYKNYELIIVDDGSTDNSLSIILRYARLDKRIKPIRLNKNFGFLNARRVGIKNASGEIISFLDADDEYMPYTLETVVNTFNKISEDTAIVFAAAKYDTGEITEPFLEEGYINFYDILCEKILQREVFIAVQKKYIENIKYKEIVFGRFFSRRIMKRYKAYYIPKTLRLYHNLSNPMSRSKIKSKMNFVLKNAKTMAYEVNDFLIEFKHDLKRACPCRYKYYLRKLFSYAVLSGNRVILFKRILEGFYLTPSIKLFYYVILSIFPTKLVQKFYSKRILCEVEHNV